MHVCWHLRCLCAHSAHKNMNKRWTTVRWNHSITIAISSWLWLCWSKDYENEWKKEKERKKCNHRMLHQHPYGCYWSPTTTTTTTTMWPMHLRRCRPWTMKKILSATTICTLVNASNVRDVCATIFTLRLCVMAAIVSETIAADAYYIVLLRFYHYYHPYVCLCASHGYLMDTIYVCAFVVEKGKQCQSKRVRERENSRCLCHVFQFVMHVQSIRREQNKLVLLTCFVYNNNSTYTLEHFQSAVAVDAMNYEAFSHKSAQVEWAVAKEQRIILIIGICSYFVVSSHK